MKAFVLKKIPFGESDLILRFLQENGEVISGFAAGGRKSKRRFSHQFDLTGLYDLEWGKSVSAQKLRHLSRCELIHHHSALSRDMNALCRWAMVLEWIALDEDHSFDFAEILALRENLLQPNALYHLFFIRQMKLHGLHPELEQCVVCGKAVHDKILFNFSEGGVVHTNCSKGALLHPDAHRFLLQVLREESEVLEISIPAFRSLDEILIPFLEWQLGRSMKSQKVFAETNLLAQQTVQ